MRTPGPWKVLDLRHQGGGQIKITGEPSPWSSRYVANVLVSNPAAPDNAAFIVRACNAHDGLVEALRDIANGENMSPGCNSAIDLGDRTSLRYEFMTWAQERARAALAAAEEG